MEGTRAGPETEPEDRRIRRSLWIFGGALTALALLVGARIATGGDVLDWLALALVLVAAGAAAANLTAVRALEARRRTEAESVARLLRGLSRSVSADAIVAAIADELAAVVDADHVVVVRRRTDPPRVEATLVSRRPGVPSSTTTLPASDLDDPGPARTAQRRRPARDGDRDRGGRANRVADRVAEHLHSVYGLRETLAAPLVVGDSVAGALVLSRRLAGPWSQAARRLLDEAAAEASFALGRAQSYDRAEAEASTDALTGLPNRRYFDEYCGLLARRRRAGDALGAMMVDIDHFKRLNDAFGHAVGDEVLRAVAGAIAGAVREEDLPARFGGEEFVVLLRDPSPAVAASVGERVRRSVAGLDLAGVGVPGVTVSVGVAIQEAPDRPVAEIVAAADQALYRAKRAGRDRVVVAGS